VKSRIRLGGAVPLVLFCVILAGCNSKPTVQPKQVETTDLQSAVHDGDVRTFYQARNWQPAWDKKSERELLDLLSQSTAQGLRTELFFKGDLPTDPSQREAELTRAALAYAAALAHGYVDPTKLGRPYTVPRPKVDVTAGLAQAIQQGKLADWFASLAPQTDEYRALSAAYVDALHRVAATHGSQVPTGKPLKPGRRDPRLAPIANALAANGYLPAPAQNAPAPQRYSGALVAAVKRLQADYGLKANGIIGDDTIAMLNSGPALRARQLAVALERLRWLERDPPPTRIDVNTAASFLDYWKDGAHQLQLRVINGQPDKWTTPEIQGHIFQLVANPYWRVPDRIYDDELSKKSQAYLAANKFTFRDGRMIQLPGPKNSLGQVKFDMDDPQQIYLHDTPFKSWFAAPDRHRSHGCVRVQNALDFAFQLATEDGVVDKFQEAMASGDENYVKLKRQIPVRLMYRTAFWDGSQVRLVPDVYGWDDDVARALGLEHGPPRGTFQRQEDVGP
jgi:murein L,D-transpeptidase YcbB/YkuD